MSVLETTWSGSEAVIDLAAMKANAEILKKEAGGVDLMAVVKADSYGHGAVPVSRALEPGVEAFGVASVDEGVQLRRAGIRKPILVFGVPNRNSAPAIYDYRLTATISHLNQFEILTPDTRYQVNIDTGMRRVGIMPEQTGALRAKVERYNGLRCCGVYSHYATADEPNSDVVHKQQRRFAEVRRELDLDVPFHMSNTAAVAHYDIEHHDMIRVGVGLSGYTPGRSQWDKLTPALKWTTRLALVRAVRRGDGVSYGSSWYAPEDGFLGTLPVGYADGVARALSHRLDVSIRDKRYPVVGNITMDYCMVFLGGDQLPEGEPVHLLGDPALRANEWAERADSITHEVLCRLSPRVRRRYIG